MKKIDVIVHKDLRRLEGRYYLGLLVDEWRAAEIDVRIGVGTSRKTPPREERKEPAVPQERPDHTTTNDARRPIPAGMEGTQPVGSAGERVTLHHDKCCALPPGTGSRPDTQRIPEGCEDVDRFGTFPCRIETSKSRRSDVTRSRHPFRMPPSKWRGASFPRW